MAEDEPAYLPIESSLVGVIIGINFEGEYNEIKEAAEDYTSKIDLQSLDWQEGRPQLQIDPFI